MVSNGGGAGAGDKVKNGFKGALGYELWILCVHRLSETVSEPHTRRTGTGKVFTCLTLL